VKVLCGGVERPGETSRIRHERGHAIEDGGHLSKNQVRCRYRILPAQISKNSAIRAFIGVR
jgi:hypothetical protein